MPYYGRIYFEMNEEEPATYITLQHVASADHLVQFADVLSGYTRARITHVEFIQIIFTEDNTSTGNFDSCLLRGIVKFRDTEKKLWAVPIPAPVDTMFEVVEGSRQVKQAVGKLLTAAYTAMSNELFIYEHGWLVGNTY
jgi:hypothetical protein